MEVLQMRTRAGARLWLLALAVLLPLAPAAPARAAVDLQRVVSPG
jgi:hypothetical protein